MSDPASSDVVVELRRPYASHRRVLPPDWPIDRLAQFLTERWRQS